ncbi:MAG TPA: SgcJ/EcaC family oxidoreductase [Terriglobales bacterium]|jgi:uncharacterized protein (TIGR02246 family)|nr:SgcJ/EcaC family oxidoreductase [Terriglobales bacterium]
MLSRLLMIVLCVTGVALCQNAPATNDQGIQKLVASFMDAWNSHDAHAFAETFAEDADFTNVIGRSAHGRKAVEEFHAPMFATRFKNTHLTAGEVKVRTINPDIASVDVSWEMTGAIETDGTPLPTRKGLLNWVVTRHDDRWLIAVMHNQEFTPRKQQ